MGQTRRAAMTGLAGILWGAASRAGPAAWIPERIAALEGQLRANPHVRALLMERRGTLFSHYRADTQPGTRLNVASVTKSVVALVTGIAIERGLIAGVNEPLAAFFPEHAQGANANALQRVRLRHLLTLSTGFDRQGLDANTDYPDFTGKLYAPGLLAHALSRRLLEPPGTRFYYSNMEAHLVAVALARRAGMPLADFAREALFAPLGIEGAEWAAGQDGVPDGAAGLRLSPTDLLRIGQMMRAGGRWQERQVVPQAFVREATSRQGDSDLPPRGPKELWGYGYLWWLASTPGDNLRAYYAAGYGGQFLYVVPDLDLVIVALTEHVSREVAGRTAALVRDYAVPAVPR